MEKNGVSLVVKNRLGSGYDYQFKLDFLKSKEKLTESTKLNYARFLKIISDFENKYSKCVFQFDEREINDFISQINTGSINNVFAILNEYFKYCKKHKYFDIENNISKTLKDFGINKAPFEKSVGSYVTSLDDLISSASKVVNAKRDLLAAVLYYMGFDGKDVIKLRVSNVDFINKSIIYKDRRYTGVHDSILDIIKNNIININDSSEFLIKALTGNKKLTLDTGSALVNDLNTDSARKITKKNLKYKALRNAGALAYYVANEKSFTGENYLMNKIKLFKLFGLMNNPRQDRRCTYDNEFNSKLTVFKSLVKNVERVFTADITVTENEYNFAKSSISGYEVKDSDNFLDSLKKSYKEFPEKSGNRESNHERNQRIGKHNEEVVKNSLLQFKSVKDVVKMEDYSGFDFKVEINSDIHRFEVKTLNNDLEFHITINEINSIFDKTKNNYVIALVNEDHIYVIKNVAEALGLSKDFAYNLYGNDKVKIAAESFRVRLTPSLIKGLCSLKAYVKSCKRLVNSKIN